MILTVIAAALFLFQSPSPVTATPPQSDVATSKVADAQKPEPKALQKVRRIYVDSFGSTEAAQQFQAMIVASLTDSKRLTVTEDKAKADAILKGFTSEKSSQEIHAYRSATAAGRSAIDDSSVNTETIDSAKASARLVNSDGDVIWTSTQESKGAKYKGASADVADKIVKQLLRDIEKSEKTAVATETPK